MKDDDNDDRSGFIFVRGISRDTKEAFKAWCALKKSNMTREIERLIWEAIEESPSAQDSKGGCNYAER